MDNNLLVVGLAVFCLILGSIAWGQPRAGNRVFYWHQTIAGLDETPDRFYAQVYQALRESLNLRQISLAGFGFGPTRLYEGSHIFTDRPLYLEARYKHLTYYLYASQTPAGFFVSTWMHSKYVRGDDKPTVLPAGFRYFARQTLFQYDATLMFSESVHTVVLSVLDQYIQDQQLKPLEAAERVPVMHAFYGRSLAPATATTPVAGATFHEAPQDLLPKVSATTPHMSPPVAPSSDDGGGRRLPL